MSKAQISPQMGICQMIRIATSELRIKSEQPVNAVFFVNLNWSFAMSPSKASALAIGAAVLGFTVGVSGLAVADFGMSGPGSQLGMPQYMKADSKAIAELGNNEGVYVDKTTFKLHMGKPKAIPSLEVLAKGAQEVTTGAIIFRHDGKVYLADAKPATE
jgi:hypothetical protein